MTSTFVGDHQSLGNRHLLRYRSGPLCLLSNARLGAVTFVHRFGSALNENIHFHCCVIDGVFSAEGKAVRFEKAAINAGAIAKVHAAVRERVLRLFKRRALLSPEDMETMRQWGHQGGC